MAQLFHTKGQTFSARPAKRGNGFCVRGAYWKRPARELDKQEVNSTQERWNYEGGGRFDSLEEAQLNIEPFQACVEYIRTEECDRGGGGGGGGASHKKEYAAAVPRPEYTRAGGRNEEKAKAAFDQRLKKRPNGAQSEVAKKRKLPDSLQATARARRAKKFAQVLQKVRRRVKELACRRAKVEFKLDLLQREAETSGLKMYGADGGRLPLPHAAAGAGGAERAAEDSDSDSDDADSMLRAESPVM